jgi:tetratricopeptide (TPR) repeat protein
MRHTARDGREPVVFVVLPSRGRAMGLRNVVCAACGVLAVGWGAMAQETVNLEYKLQPGTELIYKVSGTIKSGPSSVSGNVEGTNSGMMRLVVADVDASGVMLIGQLPAIENSTGEATPRGEQKTYSTYAEVSVYRMDRAGNLAVRKLKNDEQLKVGGRLTIWQFDRWKMDSAIMPAGAVAVGATWESGTNSAGTPMPIPAQVKVASTLVEIKTADGHKCALIKSRVSPDDRNIILGMPDIAVSGDVETLFDVDGGMVRNVNSKLTFKIKNAAGEHTVTFETTTVLDSMKMLPPAEAAREGKVIRTLDGVVANLYDGDYVQAEETLENLKPTELPAAWRTGINKAIGRVKPLAQRGREEAALQLYNEAEKAAIEKKWADAAAKYKSVYERYPDANMVTMALYRGAMVYEKHLKDKKSADELRQQLVTYQQKRAAGGDPDELYRLAQAYGYAGDAEKAISTYRKVLAVERPRVDRRFMAQYHIGEMFEDLGRKAEAVEAYKAALAMPNEDENDTQVKEEVKKKIEALTAATPK